MAKDADGGKRVFVPRALSELVPGVTRPAYKRRSPAGALLMSEWATIVGPALAAQTEPRRLSGSTLTVACAGPVALELQHMAVALIGRINGHAGREVVTALRFVQAEIMAPVMAKPRPVVAPEPIEGLPEGDLNDALSSLQAAIRARSLVPRSADDGVRGAARLPAGRGQRPRLKFF